MPVLENVKWERFAQEIVKGASQREAYKIAGYSADNDEAADASASRLLARAKVRLRIAELQEKIEEKTVEKTSISKAWVIAKLVENVDRAMTAEPVVDAHGKPTGEYKYNGAVANRALELIGKEYGMFVERKEVGEPGDFARLSDEELDEAVDSAVKELMRATREAGRSAKH